MKESKIWDRFPQFLREYVFSLGWKELYEVQERAAEVILEKDDNLLLSCATASGKTEAVFFPMLADICSRDEKAVGTQILYIAPLKALINDQFGRISALCRDAGITVSHRHGEVSSYDKEKYLKNPSCILQITPESLEAMLMRRPTEAKNALSPLKYIVIDELHSVMGADRGNQIRCLIGRISDMKGRTTRIFGLSATIGDVDGTCKWISECNGRKTQCPVTEKTPFRASLLFEAFDTREECERCVYDAVKKKNSLVFANSRDETERITFALRDIAKKRSDRDDIYIHHGNISTALRKDAERALKSPDLHSVVCATSTLELGIDIGRLERVVSLGSPNTVSGFLQRLGRSGRRDTVPEMLSVFCREDVTEDEDNGNEELFPWELLQGIAIVELYRRERFVEPPERRKYPYSLLCHQTISVLASNPEGLTPPELARKVLSLAPFGKIPSEDFKLLLRNLGKHGYISQVDGGRLIVGLAAEKMISSYKFLAVFKDEESYTVKDDNGKELGVLPEAVMPGGSFALAGRSWVCERLDSETKTIYARLVGGKMSSCWRGSLAGIDTHIAKYVSLILSEEEIYPYLGRGAAKVLTEARAKARTLGVPEKKIVRVAPESYLFLPWIGSVGMATLRRYIEYSAESMLLSGVSQDSPYVLSFKMRDADIPLFCEYLKRRVFTDKAENGRLVGSGEHYLIEKFDSLVPQELLMKAYAEDRLDMTDVAELVKTL